MNRFLIGFFFFVTACMVGLAAWYPQDFAIALATFVLGSLLGGVGAYHAFVSIHDKGFERSQQLASKQVSAPAAMLREQRLQEAMEEKKNQKATEKKVTKPIPQFKLTGLRNK